MDLPAVPEVMSHGQREIKPNQQELARGPSSFFTAEQWGSDRPYSEQSVTLQASLE